MNFSLPIDKIIKYRGIQISLSKIENLLRSHVDVVKVSVVGVPHIPEDEYSTAFVTKIPCSKVKLYRKN